MKFIVKVNDLLIAEIFFAKNATALSNRLCSEMGILPEDLKIISESP